MAPMKYSFFFQAEDGIRDADVTGVQTCALPISQVNLAGFPEMKKPLLSQGLPFCCAREQIRTATHLVRHPLKMVRLPISPPGHFYVFLQSLVALLKKINLS